MRHRVYIDAVLERGDRSGHAAGPDLQQIGAAGDQRMFAHPEHMRRELIDEIGWFSRVCEEIAARDIDVGFESQRDRVTLVCGIERAVKGDDLLYPRQSARAHHQHASTRRDGTGHHRARKPAKIAIWAIDPLDRKPKWPLRMAIGNVYRMEVIEQRRALIPRHTRRALDYVVTEPGGERDRCDRHIAEVPRKAIKAVGDLLKAAPLESHQVYLIDGEHEVTNAEQRTDKGVAAGLRQYALARVDEDHREVGGRRPGRHIARVLLVPRCVGDDEGALRRCEEPVGHIDRNSLLPLVFQSVQQEREVQVAPGCAKPARFALQRGELIVQDQRAVVEEPADQSRLAVIDRSAGQKAEKIFAGPGARVTVTLGHQKYPSRFLRSIAASSSLSISRPSRSERRVARNSATMWAGAAAMDSMAPVSG